MTDALFAAISGGDLARLTELLATGADVRAIQLQHPPFTTLQAAIDILEDGGPIDALVLLLRAGAPVDARDGLNDSTPLLMAVFREQLAAVRILLAAGANPNVKGSEGDTPLSFCADHSWLEMAELLLRCGATETIDAPGGEMAMNALGSAVSRLDVAMVRLLLEHGARPLAEDGDRRTALDVLRYVAEPTDDDDRAHLAEIKALLGSPASYR